MPECSLHKLVADVAVLSEGRVVLAKYKDTSKYDHQSGWFLPDDFLLHAEHPEAAAKRILSEQIDLQAPALTLSHIESFGNGAWHLIFHYKINFDKVPKFTPSENLATAEWFDLKKLPDRSEVAHHGWAIDVLSEMKAKQDSL